MTRGALLVACVAAGCSVLSPPPRPTFRYLTLSVVTASAPAVTPRASVALEPVELPGYLDGVELVLRKSNDEIERAAADRWAEPLAAGLSRTLAGDLDAALGPAGIAARSRADGAAQLVIAVSFDRFELSSAGQAELVARWTIRAPGGGPTHRGGLSERSPLFGGERAGPAIAAALSRALARLADAIAADVVSALVAQLPGRARRAGAIPAPGLTVGVK